MNNIIYLACMYGMSTYDAVFKKEDKPVPNACKYHVLMSEGLVANGMSLNTICVLPVNKKYCDSLRVKAPKCEERGVRYRYVPMYNIRIFRHIVLFLYSFFRVLFSKNDSVLMYDGLVIVASYGACLAAKLKHIPRLCIVTDIPEYMRTSAIERKLNDKVMSFASAFVLLTEQMNEKVNKNGKPHIVLEGHSDQKMKSAMIAKIRSTKKVVLYAGLLEEEYGLKNLCEAFVRIGKEDEELHIYGDGNYKPNIIDISKVHKNIVYHGVVKNTEVVQAEINATILVNPRSCENDFTKYSFPSKTLEYMSTGTPVIMTKLPGMPEEYCDYVLLFKNGSVDAISNGLRKALDLPTETLKRIGVKAKDFVLTEKTNIVQSKKIIDFMKRSFDRNSHRT